MHRIQCSSHSMNPVSSYSPEARSKELIQKVVFYLDKQEQVIGRIDSKLSRSAKIISKLHTVDTKWVRGSQCPRPIISNAEPFVNPMVLCEMLLFRWSCCQGIIKEKVDSK